MKRIFPGSENRYVVLAVLTIAYAVNLLDRQILPILAEPIKRDLMLSDTQIGLLSGLVFSLFYATLGMPVARLADRTNRVWVIAASTALFSVFTGACAFAGNFLQLAAARIGVAVGEAGGAPPSYSLIADYFPVRERALALSILSLGLPLGIAGGALLAGTIGARYGWQAVFLWAAVPGLVVALLIMATISEPRRSVPQLTVADRVESASLMAAIGAYFRNPLLLRVSLGHGFAAFVANAMLAWMPAFLMREKGMLLGQVGQYYSVTSGLAMVAGLLLGGLTTRSLIRRGEHVLALVPAVGLTIAAPCLVATLYAPEWWLTLVIFTVPASLTMISVGPAAAIVQNAIAPSERSQGAAILLFITNVIGLGLGPLYVGIFSDVSTSYGSERGLMIGLIALVPFFFVSASAFYSASKLLRSSAPLESTTI